MKRTIFVLKLLMKYFMKPKKQTVTYLHNSLRYTVMCLLANKGGYEAKKIAFWVFMTSGVIKY